MPYISPEDREHIESADLGQLIDKLAAALASVPSGKVGGALNYTICRLAIGSLKPKGYSQLSDMLGHVHSAETEMRRRLLDPYEDECIEKNGDLKEFQ